MQKISFKNSQSDYAQSKFTESASGVKKSDIVQKATTTVSAFAPAVPILLLQNFFSKTALKKMYNVAKNFNADEIKALNDGATEILKTKDFANSLTINNITSKTNIGNYVRPPITAQALQQVQEGFNAFFDSVNTIYVNKEIAPNLLFHEMGHAHNFKFSNFSRKMLRFYQPSQVAPFIIALSSLFLNEEKPKDGGELTKFQKIKNGFRKSLPFIAAVSSFPMLYEEAAATNKANKWLRELFDTNFVKKVSKSYKFGFLTYLAVPISAFLISFLGMKYKDFLSSENKKKTSNSQPKIGV